MLYSKLFLYINLKKITSIELWTNLKPSFNHLKKSYCQAYFHILDEK